MKTKVQVTSLTFIDPGIESLVFGRRFALRLAKACGWADIRTQVGNLRNRLQSLGEIDLLDEMNADIEESNIEQAQYKR